MGATRTKRRVMLRWIKQEIKYIKDFYATYKWYIEGIVLYVALWFIAGALCVLMCG